MWTVAGRAVPAIGWLRTYDRSWLRADVVAGLTAGGVVIPQAMAYATVAGLPVQVGLMTCIVPMAVYALLGGSRRMSLSTTSTIVALTATALASVGSAATTDPMGTAATLTLLVGLTLLVIRVLRLSFLVESVSELVMIGLKVGVGLTISVSQLPAVLGLATSGKGFLGGIGNVLHHLSDISLVTTVLSAATIILVLLLAKVAPRVPGPLVALALGIGLVVVANLDAHGVQLIPKVPRGLIAPAVPSTDNVGPLAPYAVAIALMALLESVAVARATREPEDPRLDNNQEIVAVGAASVAGSFFFTVPVAGGFSQTLVNSTAGARSQVSELVTATLAVVTAFVLAPVLSQLPEATLGSVVLIAVSSLVSLKDLKRVARVDRTEFALAVATGVVVLFTNLLVGVIVGVALTYLLVLHSLDHPVVVEVRPLPTGGARPVLGTEVPPLVPVPGLLALRIEGGLFTANIRSVEQILLEAVDACERRPEVLVVDVQGTRDTTFYVMEVFFGLDDQLARHGTQLWIAGIPVQAKIKAMRTRQWPEWVAAGKLYPTVELAFAAFRRPGPDPVPEPLRKTPPGSD